MVEQFKNRNIGQQNYKLIEIEEYPKTPWEKFKRVVRRTFRYELFVGLWIVFREMVKFNIHTVKYPKEKLPIGPRYRAVHKLLRLLESGNERCIGCGLCEKICIAKCIRIDTKMDENNRKIPTAYTINLGRCIFCGYCAEVCPELAIVHGQNYENASEQRAHFVLKEDMLTPLDFLKGQKEFPGFGAPSDDADKFIKKTPLAY
ncbi:NADH-quinone oxidoreductase subunit NuoI [Nitrosophilus alvini]|uniref:NADH-quinone oxidoreductase subunit NuoI n=1 Tax=Nitrosophilus alvini TaxID=2714855 RepID=UPI00190A5BAE|nr:NADH-quinone oxidoreductase subunit NuoI [Nitrosophilus alvini]